MNKLHVPCLATISKDNYRPQRSWGKVIFSQASVILLTGGVCSRGGLVPGVPVPGGCLVLGGCLVPGRCLLQGCLLWEGACSGRVPALGGCLLWEGACSWGFWSGKGGCAWWRPPGMATAAGGTHSTGMHSCCKRLFVVLCDAAFHRVQKDHGLFFSP